HQTPHHGIDLETPLDRWAQQAGEVRYLEQQVDLDDLFLSEALRKVKSDRTVRRNGLMFEVDAIVVGESVTLRFDPGKPCAPVQVIHEGKFICLAPLVDIYANCHVKRHRPSDNPTASTQLSESSSGSESKQSVKPPSNPLALRELSSSSDDENSNNDGGTSCT
ncbi:MAG: Mu transposase C-terminal domain-containing protein, partial [Methylococcales bacterium]|nr:Mu transposase C-terminal domain-containing protein [Methylococcales bacterium]